MCLSLNPLSSFHLFEGSLNVKVGVLFSRGNFLSLLERIALC